MTRKKGGSALVLKMNEKESLPPRVIKGSKRGEKRIALHSV